MLVSQMNSIRVGHIGQLATSSHSKKKHLRPQRRREPLCHSSSRQHSSSTAVAMTWHISQGNTEPSLWSSDNCSNSTYSISDLLSPMFAETLSLVLWIPSKRLLPIRHLDQLRLPFAGKRSPIWLLRGPSPCCPRFAGKHRLSRHAPRPR